VVLLVASLVLALAVSLVLALLAVSLVLVLVARKDPVSRRLIKGVSDSLFAFHSSSHHLLHVYLDFLLQNLYYSAR